MIENVRISASKNNLNLQSMPDDDPKSEAREESLAISAFFYDLPDEFGKFNGIISRMFCRLIQRRNF